MKTLIKFLLSIVLTLLLIPSAMAGEIVTPNVFQSGTPAIAAEVNANFSVIETEVNDNNVRITNLETQTSNLVTGCPTGESIRQIAADGTITCEEDTDTDTIYFTGTGLSLSGTTFQLAPGTVSVQGRAFQKVIDNIDNANYCVLVKPLAASFSFFLPIPGATSVACDAVAGVQLPDDVTLTGLYCTVYDDFATNAIQGSLQRVDMDTGAVHTVYLTDQSVDVNDEQVVVDITPDGIGRNIVNNATYAYTLAFYYTTFDFSTMGSLGRFYGCRITYQP